MRWIEEAAGRPALRLFVGDRHPLLAAALASLLQSPQHDVIVTASTADDARRRIAANAIDIAIIDIDLDAASIAGDIGQPVIIVAATADHPAIAAALDSPARGLVLKSDSAESLAQCLAAVAAGGRWFDREALAQARDRLQSIGGAATLTRRERDVARLVATGQRNRVIGNTLGISEGTVKMHLHNVYAKLGLESRTQLAMDERLRSMA